MHVLILTPVFPHSGSPTEGLFNEQHALSLTRAGNQVTIVVCKPWLPSVVAKRWKRYGPLARLTQPEERNGIEVRFARYLHIPQYHGPQLTVSSCVRSILRTIRSVDSGNPYDIVQVHSSWPVGLAAPTIARSLHRPFVITMHIQDDARLFGRRKGASLYKRMFEKASAVVVVGRPLERFLRPWLSEFQGHLAEWFRTASIWMIYEGAERPRSKRKGWGNIVSVGNLWPTKGMDAEP